MEMDFQRDFDLLLLVHYYVLLLYVIACCHVVAYAETNKIKWYARLIV